MKKPYMENYSQKTYYRAVPTVWQGYSYLFPVVNILPVLPASEVIYAWIYVQCGPPQAVGKSINHSLGNTTLQNTR